MIRVVTDFWLLVEHSLAPPHGLPLNDQLLNLVFDLHTQVSDDRAATSNADADQDDEFANHGLGRKKLCRRRNLSRKNVGQKMNS